MTKLTMDPGQETKDRGTEDVERQHELDSIVVL